MADAKEQRTDRVDAQALDDAIKLLELLKSSRFTIWDDQDKKSFELGITALRYMKGSLYGE